MASDREASRRAPRRLAVVDLGTNSIRMEVFEVARGRIRSLALHKSMIRLGDRLFLSGKVDREALRRLMDRLSDFGEEAREWGVDRFVAFATSAMREARDRARALKEIHRRTGISIRVIPGIEEARLIATGILANDPRCRGFFGLVDIGGGSTEISLCSNRRVLRAVSLPLGVARLQQLFLKTIPPRSVEPLQAHVRAMVTRRIGRSLRRPPEKLIGSSGTVKSLSRILFHAHGDRVIRLDRLAALREEMTGMTRRQLLAIPGMRRKRVDLILAGAVVLEEIMRALQVKRVLPTRYALRDGVVKTAISSGN